MKAYKVFMVGRRGWKNGPVLMSLYARGDATVYYARGQWSEAPGWLWERGYGLCCFETEEKAKKYFLQIPWNYTELWEVEAEEVLTKLPPAMDLRALNWKQLQVVEDGWVEGTIMARRVKLIRQIL